MPGGGVDRAAGEIRKGGVNIVRSIELVEVSRILDDAGAVAVRVKVTSCHVPLAAIHDFSCTRRGLRIEIKVSARTLVEGAVIDDRAAIQTELRVVCLHKLSGEAQGHVAVDRAGREIPPGGRELGGTGDNAAGDAEPTGRSAVDRADVSSK